MFVIYCDAMMTLLSVIPIMSGAISIALLIIVLRLRKDEREAKAILAELRQKKDAFKDENKQISDEMLLHRMEIELWEKAKKRISGRKVPGSLVLTGLLFTTTSCKPGTEAVGICACMSLTLILLGAVIIKAFSLAGTLKEILLIKKDVAGLEEKNARLKKKMAELKAKRIRIGGEIDAFIDAATRSEAGPEGDVSEFRKKVTGIMKSHIGDTDFSIDSLIKELGMSRSSFFNRWRKETGLTANCMLHDMRLKEAWDQLKEGRKNVSEIGYDLGYNSLSYFSRCFKAKYGISPSKVRN